MNAIDQLETLMLYTGKGLDDLPHKRRRCFNGTNHGNKIGDINVPSADVLWQATRDEREKILGTALKAVGSATPGVEVGRGKGKEKKESEPTWHLTMDSKFYSECAHSYCLKRVINLSGSDGLFELAMRQEKVQVLTVCLNDYHKAALTTRLEFKALKDMCDSTSPDHEPPLAALFNGEATKSAAVTKTVGGSAPGAVASKQKAGSLLEKMQAKLQTIKKKAAAAPTGDEEGEGDEESEDE